jgi:dTDP-glucose pyrophosphorylase
MAEDCFRFQLITGDGVLDMQGLENFTRTTNLSQRGVSYAVVAIMGPQSGGMYSFYLVSVVICVCIAH